MPWWISERVGYTSSVVPGDTVVVAGVGVSRSMVLVVEAVDEELNLIYYIAIIKLL